ncbi:aminotransferase class V-fold PLP-dependent enzyme [Streptomyces odontomachi]|uniref:aminotransferase class V-fold PLP-dependent enzyme n=1 Tax=Streptomyces odontomachi TaxID=2944940 RepID=UPI0021089C45|nr:aminotransferase class V-fold PLP-dependent enzyme [Streptomyces sp. ODS25]
MFDQRTLTHLRATEYGYLDENHHVYLDYAGAGLPARFQLAMQAERITSGCYGNPHSENPTSTATEELLVRTRRAVLRFFNADPEQYAVIFTPNATGAMRLVGEAYPFDPRSPLVLTTDNHNSVNGLREYAKAQGTGTVYIPLDTPGLRVSDQAVHTALAQAARNGRAGTERAARGLFAYPAQSNFSGVWHPLEWIDTAHSLGYDVLLDAAAYVTTNRLDLAVLQPDFVAVSWYKVFGYPTGVGCLIARRPALARLRRPWFAGGTIQMASAQGQWHRMTDDESAFEDGTLNFLSIPDVEVGLDWIRGIGIDTVHDHVTALTGRLLTGLAELRHGSGAPMVRLYGPADTERRGGTVAMNFLDPQGRIVDERVVARDAAARTISLRTGCFCNPGAGETVFGLGHSVLRRAAHDRLDTVDDYLADLELPSGGAVRVSLGLASHLDDVETFLEFAAETYRDRIPEAATLPRRLRC